MQRRPLFQDRPRWNTQAIIERPVTQEFNLISPSTGRLQWILGAFYMHDIREVALDIKSQAIPQTYPCRYLLCDQVRGRIRSAHLRAHSQSAVAGRLRYTHDSSSVPQSANIKMMFGIPGVPPIIIPAGGYQDDSAVTGKVALNWTVNDDNFLYGFVAKGSKAGGFNAAGAAGPQTNFAPEIVWDYELGWKGTFFDKHCAPTSAGSGTITPTCRSTHSIRALVSSPWSMQASPRSRALRRNCTGTSAD